METTGPALSPFEEESSGLRFDGELETAFRAFRLRRDGALALIICGFSVVGHALMAVNDLRLGGEHVTVLLELRLAVIAWSLVVIPLFQRAAAHRQRDWLLFLSAVLIDGAAVAVAALRPPQHAGFTVIMGVVTLLHFVVLPVPLRFQLAAAGLYACAHVALLFDPGKDLDPSIQLTAITFTAGALLAGAITSRIVDHSDRLVFAQLEQKTRLSAELARTLEELRTLQGLLPICQFCKSIRDPDGEWHSVEAYIARGSRATFSHGICPTCMARHYPEEGVG